jgi:hypothetical protein
MTMFHQTAGRVAWRSWMTGALLLGATTGAAAADFGALEKEIQALAQLPGEPRQVASAGDKRAKSLPLLTLENSEPPRGGKRRLVLLGGLDGNDRGVDAVVAAVRWFKTQAPASVRDNWTLIVMPCGNPEGWLQLKPTNDTGGKPAVNYPPEGAGYNERRNLEARFIWQWVIRQAPDLVLDVQGGNRTVWRVPPAWASLGAPVSAQPLVGADSLPMALSRGTPAGLGTVPGLMVQTSGTDGPAVLQAALRAAANLPRSQMRQAIIRRGDGAGLGGE